MSLLHFVPRRWLAAGLIAGALTLGPGVGLAAAHDSVVAANPANGGTVAVFPAEIALTFSGEPRDGFNTIAVTNSDTKAVLFDGEPTVSGREVSIAVPENIVSSAGSGEYTIGFQITSSDGHATRGSTTFTVAGDSSSLTTTPIETNSIPESTEETSSHGAGWAWFAGIAAVVVILAVVIILVVKRRQH